jgi:CRISPR/Cas system-associated exonuclease Cas4 (RecB family)
MAAPDLPPRTSASQLVSFSMCPRKFFLSYIERAEPEFRSISLTLGSAVHESITWFFGERLEGRTPTIDDATRIAKADLCADGNCTNLRWKQHTPATLEAEAVRLVRMYLEAKGSLAVIAVEQTFTVPLVDLTTGEILGRQIRGYFDLTLEDRIIEIKTAAKAWSDWDLQRHLQIGCYAYASHLLHGGNSLIEVHALVKLKTAPRVQQLVVERSAVDLWWWLRAAAEIESAIAAGNYPPSPGPLCRECEFQRRCESMKPEVIAPRHFNSRRPAPLAETLSALA